MKLCPSCQRTYVDDGMSFCLDDGTPLVSAPPPASGVDPGATMKIPAARLTHQAPTEIMPGEELGPTIPARTIPAQRSAPEVAPEPSTRKQSPLPWILGAALILGLSGIVIALIVTRTGGGTENSQAAQTGNQSRNSSSVSDSNTVATTRGEIQSPDLSQTTISNKPVEAQASRTPEQKLPTAEQTPTPRGRPSPVADEGPPPASPEPSAQRPRAPISGGVLNGKAISKPAPAYPPIARATRASGTVTVQVLVDESGRVISARAVSGHPLLQQAAVQAARGARFSPTLLSGQPVKVSGVLTYTFSPE